VKVAACVIAKNEEKNLPRLLKSLKGKFEEIVVVDTGSTDRTVEVAKSFGCKVVSHPWRGFADARNRAVREVSEKVDWLWHFDADFELEEEEFKKALTYLKFYLNSPVEGLLIGVRNFSSTGEVKALSSHIFIHRPGIEWAGKVHECPKVERVAGIPVFVNHYGYSDFRVQIEKARRNYGLLKEELQSLEPGTREHAVKLFYLIQTLTILGYEDSSCLEEVKRLGEEFFSAIRGREEEFGFFAVYAYNYLLSALEVAGEEEELERYLKEVFEKELPVPDFYLKAYGFFKRRGEYGEAFQSLKRAAELYDALEENPFSFGIAFATDRLEAFKNLLLEEDFSPFSGREVRGSGKFTKLLSALTSPPEKRLRLLKKLALRHPDEELFSKLLLKEALSQGRAEELFPLLSRLPPSTSRYFLEGALRELKGDYGGALELYGLYLQRRKDPWVAARFLELAKKLSPTSDIEGQKETLEKEVGHGTED